MAGAAAEHSEAHQKTCAVFGSCKEYIRRSEHVATRKARHFFCNKARSLSVAFRLGQSEKHPFASRINSNGSIFASAAAATKSTTDASDAIAIAIKPKNLTPTSMLREISRFKTSLGEHDTVSPEPTLQSSPPRSSPTGGAAGAIAEAETCGDWVDNLLRRKDTVLLSDFLALQNPQRPSGERITTLESKRILI
jgi:hypothetical protein